MFLGQAPAGLRSCTTLGRVLSLCRNPCALPGGKKVGQSWSNQPLSPAHVCWEVICSKPCGCSIKIINRAIKEAPVALNAMLCGAGRREGLLSTPFSCQIPSQFVGWECHPGAEPELLVAFSRPLLVRVLNSCRSSGFTCPPLRVNKLISTGSGCVWLCGNGERSHSPAAGSAQGSSRAEGWIWWEGGFLLTRLLFPPATSTAQTPKIRGLQGEEAASFPGPPASPHLKGTGSDEEQKMMYSFSPFGVPGGLCVV